MKKMFSRKKPVMTEEERFRKIAMEQVKKEMKKKKEKEKKRKEMKKKMKSPKVAIAPPSMQSSSVEPMAFEEAHSTQFIPRTEVMKRLSIQPPKIDYGAEERKQAKKSDIEGISIDFKN